MILDPFTLNNIAAGSFRISEIQNNFAALEKKIRERYQEKFCMVKEYKKIKKVRKNSWFKFRNSFNFRGNEFVDTDEEYFEDEEIGAWDYYEIRNLF